MENHDKSKSNQIKNLKKKLSYKYFQDKTNLKNIDNNTSYTSSGEEDVSSLDLKHNGSIINSKLESKNKTINNKIGKENNINSANRNTVAPIQGLFLNKGIQPQSNYNILTNQNRNIYINNENMLNRLSSAKVTKLDGDPKICFGPNNIININKNIASTNNLHTINNNFVNHPFNLNKNQLIANNNILINPNLTQPLFNNNLIPRQTNFIQTVPFKTGIGITPYNQQNLINSLQPRLTNIPIDNRYSLEKNKLLFRESNISNFSDKFNTINCQDSHRNRIKQNLNVKKNTNQVLIGQQKNNINENNKVSRSIHDEFFKQANRQSSSCLNKALNINKLNNNTSKFVCNRETIVPKTNYTINNFRNSNTSNNTSSSGLSNKLFSVTNNVQQLANPAVFQTIDSTNKNSQLNNYFKIGNNPNIIIPNRNIIPSQNYNYNNILKQPQNNNLILEPYNQIVNNYNQNYDIKEFKESILLRDFGILSRPGNDETGMAKTNQDSYISKTNINNISDFNIFGVLDGHGPQGHYVSEFASEFIPNYIINNSALRGDSNTESIYNKLRLNNYQIIKQAFLVADNKLKNVNFNAKESGTTCVLVIHIGNHLICANVGDSRAIVALDDHNDPDLKYLRAIPLSIDYKPELPEESTRILMSGGVVEQAQNDFGISVGPYRVYARGKDYPGLAMSRSIGDLDGKNVGIIADPGIMEFPISKTTKFFILCSDGVWEFLTNELVKNVGRQFYLNSNANELCQELVSRSVIEWKKNDNIIDDITAISVFF